MGACFSRVEHVERVEKIAKIIPQNPPLCGDIFATFSKKFLCAEPCGTRHGPSPARCTGAPECAGMCSARSRSCSSLRNFRGCVRNHAEDQIRLQAPTQGARLQEAASKRTASKGGGHTFQKIQSPHGSSNLVLSNVNPVATASNTPHNAATLNADTAGRRMTGYRTIIMKPFGAI